MIMLAVGLTAQDPSPHHVRSSEPKILSLLDAGQLRSETFRRLIDTLDRSDVIVYVHRKITREGLRGLLANDVVLAGEYRVLHIGIEMRGAQRGLVPLLAHELQHAIEVAGDPNARDASSVERLFRRLDLRFGCGETNCSETQAAKDVEAIVSAELKANH
jgi:hypothetical protein